MKPSAKKAAPPRDPLPAEILEATGIAKVCEMIMEGQMLREIARNLGIKGHASLIQWIASDPERAKAVKDARALAAFTYDEQAIEAFDGVKDPVSLGIAREKASHYRWRAQKMNPQFGDKVDVNHSGETTVIIKDYTGRKTDA